MKKLKYIVTCLIGLATSFPVMAQTETQQAELPTTGLEFTAYLKEVGEKNLQFLAEKYNVDIAKAEVIASKVMPDPELNFEAEKDNYTIELGYTLELGKRRARINQARVDGELVNLELESYFKELRAEATVAFLDALLQRDLLELKQNSYRMMAELHHSDSIRYKLGEITLNDARQSKVEAITLLNEVYEQEAALKSANVLLNRYMGRPITQATIPVGNMQNMDNSYTLTDLLPIALEQRVDVQIARKNIQSSQSQLKLAKAERRADLGLMVGYERDWHGMWPNRNTIKGGISVPLKFSNINKGEVRARKLAISQSQLSRESKEMDIQVEVSQAYFEYEAAQKQVKQFKSGLLAESRAESRSVFEGMVYRYKRGETNIMEVLIAQRTYNEIQEQYLETMKAYAQAMVNLEYTSGIWEIEF